MEKESNKWLPDASGYWEGSWFWENQLGEIYDQGDYFLDLSQNEAKLRGMIWFTNINIPKHEITGMLDGETVNIVGPYGVAVLNFRDMHTLDGVAYTTMNGLTVRVVLHRNLKSV